ncbi:MAG: ABC transporter permease [Tannerella sp.]|jgi:hypothetical protein|nr:ABC transporter permease [Tannerella sp.]
MLKSIFKQILNRKRSNSWMVTELFLVFCLTWYIADFLFVLNCNYSLPNYRDVRHTWAVMLAQYPENHPLHRADENGGEAAEANYARILQTIRTYPGVEAVSVSFDYCEPGTGSFSEYSLRTPEDSNRFVSGQMVTLDPREDFFRVFGYTANRGKTPVSTADFDWANTNGIVLGRSTAEQLWPDCPAAGKELYLDDTRNYTVLGVVDDTKRFDYERPQNVYYRPRQLDSTSLRSATVSVRSKAAVPDDVFREAFGKEMANRLPAGNFYLKEIRSYGEIAEISKTQLGVANDIRQRTFLMIFFLLNILLCVTGTFWYRIHARREEIGIRKAMGSSNSHIRNILLTEGLCLLTLAMLPALVVEANLVYAGLIETFGTGMGNTGTAVYLPDRTALRFLITNGITWLIMAAVIVAAIRLPARKAAAMPPADALHYE